ncbi:FT-interacting protein [Trifolium repens]|nr:FT-interacting protein [Trifolium repens]
MTIPKSSDSQMMFGGRNFEMNKQQLQKTNSKTSKIFLTRSRIQRSSKIGKVRIRLSTLETDRVYTHSYPLLVVHPTGVKKMGEIQLAVRFTCSSLLNMMHMYSNPLLPKMHYIHPLTVSQLDSLRHQATQRR